VSERGWIATPNRSRTASAIAAAARDDAPACCCSTKSKISSVHLCARFGPRGWGSRPGSGERRLGGIEGLAADPKRRRHLRERDLGTRLEWVAIDHYNTDNPHVHLLVRGRDARGQGLRIHPDYLRQGLRRRSQDLATQAPGYRSEREIVQARGQSIERLHFTEVDRVLIRHGGTRGLVTVDGREP
jgi:hypothetical protein